MSVGSGLRNQTTWGMDTELEIRAGSIEWAKSDKNILEENKVSPWGRRSMRLRKWSVERTPRGSCQH